MVNIDKTDYAILKLLKTDYRMSPEDLAKKVCISKEEVSKRIDAMIKGHILFPGSIFLEKALRKMEKIDKKDCMILNLLQENCRMSYTDIGKKVSLSVDSVKKRVNKMIKNHIFFPKIQIRPRNFGFSNIVDIKIKLHNYTKEELNEFIEYLSSNTRIAEMFKVSGDWDFSIVVIAKDAEDLAETTWKIRDKFNKIISEWSESLTTMVYKFETYEMVKLMEY